MKLEGFQKICLKNFYAIDSIKLKRILFNSRIKQKFTSNIYEI